METALNKEHHPGSNQKFDNHRNHLLIMNPSEQPETTKGKTMTGIESAKTVLIGLAATLAITTGAGAWGIFRKVVTTVPVEAGWIFLAVSLTALLTIPAACIIMKDPK